MDYEIRKIVEEIDVLSLSQAEYDKLNSFYKEIITNRFPKLAKNNQIYNIRRLIMTDDLSRVEVFIAVDGKEPESLKTPNSSNLSSN